MNKGKDQVNIVLKRLGLALMYYRIAKRLTANEITERTGVNFYLIESGKRNVTLPMLLKLEKIFGEKEVSGLILRAYEDGGEWSQDGLEKRIAREQALWDSEKG